LPAHPARDPPLFVLGMLASLLVPVNSFREDPCACRYQSFIVFVHQRPANGIGTEIETQAVG
jgi:hypothetical protein